VRSAWDWCDQILWEACGSEARSGPGDEDEVLQGVAGDVCHDFIELAEKLVGRE
jgi:hypothetical protein